MVGSGISLKTKLCQCSKSNEGLQKVRKGEKRQLNTPQKNVNISTNIELHQRG